MRSEIRSRENNSVSDEATASSRAAAAHDIQIFIHRETRRRKNSGSGAHLVGVESGGFRELEPALDAAFAGGVAVVIDHALAPGAAKDGIGAARENDRIFDRDDALIVVAVQGPSLQLSAAEAAFVHHQMKGMLVVIAFFAHAAQLRAQAFERKQALSSAARLLLQVELPSILRDLPAGIAHLAIFRSGLVQHGIRVVDMQIDFTWTAQSRQPAQASVGG